MSKQKLIMVMGVQRSGTNALFYSLARDPTLTSYNESANDALYLDYFLRPEPEIRPILQRAPGGVLLKPITETFRRKITDLFREYADYDLNIVWIYRDPVNVLYSFYSMGWIPFADMGAEPLTNQWNRRNALVLEAMAQFHKQITILKYEDAAADASILHATFRRIGVRGAQWLKGDTNMGRLTAPREIQAAIDAATRATRKDLDKARTFKRTLPRRLLQLRLHAPVRKPSQDSTREGWEPAKLTDLHFWLQVQSLAHLQESAPVTQWRDEGPRAFPAVAEHPPRYVPNQIGSFGAVRFESEAKRAVSLTYGAGSDWSFSPDGSGLTLACVIKPAPHAQEMAQSKPAPLLYIGAQDHRGPALVIQWDAHRHVWTAQLWSSQTPEGHAKPMLETEYELPVNARDGWYVLSCLQKSDAGTVQLSLRVNLFAIRRSRGDFETPQIARNDSQILELGGPHFRADVAELVLVRGEPDETILIPLVRHLLKRYDIIP